ncbi:5-oxoprolinase subunit PxpA [Croceitalea marina]|uniref:5-oxoprolinase subunit PxpA n=1 Tax=Croceitalea marina TaxID=1775166 RepID=A0ABW5MU24_9FLAO
MNHKIIDINCDVGEGIGNEPILLPLISSCNIACGGHAGNEKTISEIVKLAKKYRVKVGAHPSYPDKENFGRKVIDIADEGLKISIRKQIYTFLKVAESEQAKMNHIKPHGALYNELMTDLPLALTFLEAIKGFKNNTFLYVPYNSVVAKEALSQGFKIKYEAFCDRNYNDDLTLVSRKEKNALITSPKSVLNHILRLIEDKSVKTISGSFKRIKADTFCVHGDTPEAIEILTYLSNELPKKSIEIGK